MLSNSLKVDIQSNSIYCTKVYHEFWKAIQLDGSAYKHYDDVIMTMLASQITSLTVVYSIVYSGVNQRKHQSSASLAFVREIHRGPVNFPHKWPVTRKMFPFDDVIMRYPMPTDEHPALMMMWRHVNAFRITGPLWRETTVIGGFPSQTTSTVERWCFLGC